MGWRRRWCGRALLWHHILRVLWLCGSKERGCGAVRLYALYSCERAARQKSSTSKLRTSGGMKRVRTTTQLLPNQLLTTNSPLSTSRRQASQQLRHLKRHTAGIVARVYRGVAPVSRKRVGVQQRRAKPLAPLENTASQEGASRAGESVPLANEASAIGWPGGPWTSCDPIEAFDVPSWGGDGELPQVLLIELGVTDPIGRHERQRGLRPKCLPIGGGVACHPLARLKAKDAAVVCAGGLGVAAGSRGVICVKEWPHRVDVQEVGGGKIRNHRRRAHRWRQRRERHSGAVERRVVLSPFPRRHNQHHECACCLACLLLLVAACQPPALLALTEVVKDGLQLATAHKKNSTVVREALRGAAHPMERPIGLPRTRSKGEDTAE